MRSPIFWTCLGLLVACGGGEKREPAGPVSMEPGSVDQQPGPVVMRPGPPPGGDKPGVCRNVAIPQGSSCRLLDLQFLPCQDCPTDWHRYRPNYLVKVDGVDHAIEAGTFRVPGDRSEEFKSLVEQHSPAPCAGMIVRPPCNPAATRVKLEVPWPDWLVRERK